MAKNKSSYQKLKEENLNLKRELIIVAKQPDSLEAITIRMKWSMQSDAEDAVWFGQITNCPDLVIL